jgi:hypothetical protein
MTYSAPEGDGRISHVHSMALCTEIGERLRTEAQRSSDLPPSLQMLMDRLRAQPPRSRSEPSG